MNSVPIDEAAVHLELEQLAGGPSHTNGATPAGPLPGESDPAPPLIAQMDWSRASAGLVLVVDRVLVPNWALEVEEKDALAQGISLTLSAFFPTLNIDPRVQALIVLSAVVTSIAQKRIDYANRTVVPFRKPKPTPAPSTEDAADDHRAAA